MDKSNKIENLANKYVERHIRDRHLSDDTIKEIKIAYIMIIKDFIAIVDKSTSITPPLDKGRYGRMRDRRMTKSIFPSRIIIRRSYSQKVLSVD